MKFDEKSTLEDLENDFWGEPDFGSYVVQQSDKLRKTPICDLTIENLRLLIGQKTGLNYLVPFALEKLLLNPLAEGDHYKGDLLAMIIKVPESFWQEHPDLNNMLVEIMDELEIIGKTINEELMPEKKNLTFK